MGEGEEGRGEGGEGMGYSSIPYSLMCIVPFACDSRFSERGGGGENKQGTLIANLI